MFFAMAGYAGMSYYYSDRFLREQRSMELTVHGKTSEEAEQAVAKKQRIICMEVKQEI